MKPANVKDNTYNDFDKKIKKKILNLKLVIILEYQNTKTFLLRDILQIGLKKVFLLQKSKTLFLKHILLMI